MKNIAKEASKANGKADNFEQTLFKAADKLRKNIDAAEYKHIVLGLICTTAVRFANVK